MADARFAVHAIGYLPFTNYVSVRTHTTQLCHLTCVYTSRTPLKHPGSRTIRGLTVPWGVYFCFVAWHTVEQDEAGDTLVHTFTIPNWKLCQTRWFFFKGEVGAADSPSFTCIFRYHHPGVPTDQTEEQTTGIIWSSILDGAGWGQRLTITNRLLTNLSFYLSRVGSPAGEVRFRIRLISTGLVVWERKLMNSNLISAIPTWYELEIDPPMFFNEEVRLGVWATDNGAGNLINVYISLADVKPDEHAYFRRFDGVITEHPDKDFMYKYSYREYDYGP